jgi:hypothetical protein
MKRIRGNIALNDDRNNTILQDVEIWLTETTDQRSGLRGWGGTFNLARGKWLDPMERYFIELEDGRSGEILLTRVGVGTNHPPAVNFLGSGELD